MGPNCLISLTLAWSSFREYRQAGCKHASSSHVHFGIPYFCSVSTLWSSHKLATFCIKLSLPNHSCLQIWFLKDKNCAGYVFLLTDSSIIEKKLRICRGLFKSLTKNCGFSLGTHLCLLSVLRKWNTALYKSCTVFQWENYNLFDEYISPTKKC